jgi:hypothetical protein
MIADEKLAAAVHDRTHWQPTGENAVRYTPPDVALSVLVQRVREPCRRDRYVAVLLAEGRALYVRPYATAIEAIGYTVRVPLDRP